MITKTVIDILLEQKLVTDAQVLEAKEIAEGSGTSVEQILQEKGYITPEQWAKASAELHRLPYVEKVTDAMADLMVLAKIPLKFLRDNVVIPVMVDNQLTILTANPNNFQPLDEVNLLLGGAARTAVATEKTIIDAINRYYPLEGSKQMIAAFEKEEELGPEEVDFGAIEEKDIMTMASEAPIIKLVNNILFQAAKRGASDIHIEPFEKELEVRYRIDGVLYPVMTPPKRIQGALVSRIKIMANLNIAEKRIPQDGRIDIKVAGRPIDIRVSVLPVIFGERIVMRLLDKSRSFSKLKDLGLSERDYKLMEENIHKPNGIIYITGPTGSGKTSTLYSVLGELNKPDVNIITVEDPVEYQMPGIGQVAVKDKIGLTFAAALRSILRQDPDIIMIGETRDFETAQIAVQSALTGHLVFSTLHTNNAPASITRLLDMGVEPFLIASSVILIEAQRLVRKLCPHCKQQYSPPLDLLKSIGLNEKTAKGIIFYKAVGCEECNQTGYKGRLALFEIMAMTPGIAKLTMERADTSLLRKQAIADGMTLLIDDGIRKIKEGVTTIEEVISVATIETEVVE
ncbi:MAG: pilus biosynthesis protein TapB [Candidatus Babeliales bacterium]